MAQHSVNPTYPYDQAALTHTRRISQALPVNREDFVRLCPWLGEYHIPESTITALTLKQYIRDQGLSTRAVQASAGHLVYVWPLYCQYVGGVVALFTILKELLADVNKLGQRSQVRDTKYQEMMRNCSLWILPITRLIAMGPRMVVEMCVKCSAPWYTDCCNIKSNFIGHGNPLPHFWTKGGWIACPHRDCVLKTVCLEQLLPHLKEQHDVFHDEQERQQLRLNMDVVS